MREVKSFSYDNEKSPRVAAWIAAQSDLSAAIRQLIEQHGVTLSDIDARLRRIEAALANGVVTNSTNCGAGSGTTRNAEDAELAAALNDLANL